MILPAIVTLVDPPYIVSRIIGLARYQILDTATMSTSG